MTNAKPRPSPAPAGTAWHCLGAAAPQRHRSSASQRAAGRMALLLSAAAALAPTSKKIDWYTERCGGQGYLLVNRVGEALAFAHAGMTAEGDNRVLTQKVNFHKREQLICQHVGLVPCGANLATDSEELLSVPKELRSMSQQAPLHP